MSGYINKTLDIDLGNIEKGIKDWERHVEAFNTGFNRGKVILASRTLDKLTQNMIKYGLEVSNIIGTISTTFDDDGIMITINSEYAMYVEYGTGLAGLSNPHPKPEGWQYNIGETIRPNGGWWYPTDTSDPNPHKKTFNGVLYAWTIQGQESKPFVYETWLWASRSKVQIIRKAINDELKKVRG